MRVAVEQVAAALEVAALAKVVAAIPNLTVEIGYVAAAIVARHAVFSMILPMKVSSQLLALVPLSVLVPGATNIALAKRTVNCIVAALKSVISSLSPRNHRRPRLCQW